MPLPSAIKLFIDPRTGNAFGNFSGTSSLTNPVFTLGDTATIELYLVEDTGLSAYPRQEIGFPTSPGIKVAVGAIDESPLAGTWKLSYGGDTTTALAYNATPAAVQAALNLLASITAAGGVAVSKIGDNYNIVFNSNGARTELTTDGAALIPLSTAAVATLQTGDATKPTIYLVHLQRTVAGLATSFTPTTASAITVDALTAWDGSKATYRVSISPDPKGGSFSLAFDAQTGTDVSTSAISVGATALDVQNALNIDALAGKVSVTQVKAYAYDISVTTQPGTNGLTASAAGLLSYSGYKGELNLNTAEAISLLDGAPAVETTLEVEITSESKTLTVLQIPCTLHNAVIDVGALQPLVLDTYLSQTTADGRYFKLSQNLADGTAATMRTNLGVYSTGEVDTALALKADTSALDAKADLIHTHTIADVDGLQAALESKVEFGGADFTGTITAPIIGNQLNADLVIDSYNDTGAGTHYLHRFTPYDGRFVLAPNGGGLTFPDGSNQATAGIVSGAVVNFPMVNLVPIDDPQFYDSKLHPSYIQLKSDTTQNGTQVGFAETLYANTSEVVCWRREYTDDGEGNVSLNSDNGFKINMTQGLYFVNSQNVIVSGTVRYRPTGILWSDGTTTTSRPLPISGGTLAGKINLSITTSGSITNAPLNIPPSASVPTPGVNGDVWMGQTNLFFKDGSGVNRTIATLQNGNTFTAVQTVNVTSTSTALRVTQSGTGAAFVVEDSANPDGTAFLVDASGNLGVGVNPASFTATNKVEIIGAIKADSITFNGTSQFKVNGTQTHAAGSNTHDLLISFGGSTYRMPMILVSTP